MSDRVSDDLPPEPPYDAEGGAPSWQWWAELSPAQRMALAPTVGVRHWLWAGGAERDAREPEYPGAEMDDFRAELRRAFSDDATAAAWLDTAVPAFGGQTPLELLRAGQIARVTGALYAINAGVSL